MCFLCRLADSPPLLPVPSTLLPEVPGSPSLDLNQDTSVAFITLGATMQFS